MTTRLVFGAIVSAWVLDHLGWDVELGPHVAIGFARANSIIAAVVYNNFRPRAHDMELTIATRGPGWATRGVLAAIFDYPFRQAGCVRVTATTARGNKPARKLLEQSGFKMEGVLRRGFDGREDAFVFGMLATECRWLQEMRNGKRQPQPAAAA